VAEDESDSALVDSDTDSFVEDVQVRRVTSVETEVESDSTIMVNQCHVGKEVKVSANAPKDKTIETVKPQKSAVNVLKELNSTLVDVPRESDYNATLNIDREQDGIVVELGELDNMIIDAVRESNNTIMDAPMESDNAIVLMLRGLDNVLQELIVDVLNTTEVDPTTSKNNMMDLDIPEAKNRLQMKAREDELIEAANALYTISQYHSP
jgi:hypothetical protein